jgi:hypothetical protein
VTVYRTSMTSAFTSLDFYLTLFGSSSFLKQK